MNEKIKRKVARGICLKAESVLLCKAINKSNYFLLGGGLEKLESASNALLREIKEELNIVARIQSFISVLDNCWASEGVIIFETNFLFTVDLPIEIDKPLVSEEKNLSFEWIKLKDLNEINLQPVTMKQIIVQYQNRSSFCRFRNTKFK